MIKLLYIFSIIIALVGIFGFLDPNGYAGYVTFPITIAIGGLSALLVYLKNMNSSDK